MSRIGKQAVEIPQGVSVSVSENSVIVKGPKGSLERTIDTDIAVRVDGNQVICELASEDSDRSKFGLNRSLIANMVIGCSEGFKKELEIVGVGYRANVSGNVLDLSLGYSHPIKHAIPEGINIEVDKQGKMTIEGPDKQVVGQTAAEIRGYREPEPYKGKGVRYANEKIIRKAGKAGAGGK